ncbi:MAG: hypothetical protein ACLTZY_02685 [Alistipes indistinctus]
MRRTDTAQFDPRDGRIGEIVRYRDTPRSQTLRGWFYAFHTGSWGGTVTKIIYFLSRSDRRYASAYGLLPVVEEKAPNC